MATTQLLDPIRLAMKATNDLFNSEVVGKRNFAALDDVYTAGARILPPGGPMISGREAIKQFWSVAVDSLHATAVAVTTVDAMPAGDGVVEIGAATITVEPPGQPCGAGARQVCRQLARGSGQVEVARGYLEHERVSDN